MAELDTAFQLRPVATRVGPVAIVTMDNGSDHTRPTTFGRTAFESLARVLMRLEGEQWAGMVLTGKPFVFAAGADIDQFPRLTTPELAREAGRVGHELFARIRTLPYPTLAAVNGVALGGGVEIALHCDYRTISSAIRHVAFPEVFLGIVPGWGGTQLLPRLVGAQRAVELVVANPLRQNRMLTGPQAFELGVADELLAPVEFLDESIDFLLRCVEDGPPPRAPADLADVAEICRRARMQVDDQVHGAAPAPYRALDLIEGAAGWSIEEGYRAEEEALAELLPGFQAQASVYAFDVVERRMKRGGLGRPEADPRTVRSVGLVGAGLMARQLALLFLRRLEVPVVLRDLAPEQVDDAIAWIGRELEVLASRGRLTERKARFLASVVSGGTGLEPFAGCDLVLEAVFEELAVKQQVFSELEQVVAAECVLATNTSSLSVGTIADGLTHPERVVGMHFFNPVAVLPLVELVRTSATDDVALATAWEVTSRLGKRAVLVRDAPAFVVNRILTRMTTVLMDALENGNTVEETDEAVLRLGLPMAPSVLLGMVGPQVANHVLGTLHGAFPDRFPLSQTLANFAAGRDDVAVRGEHRRTVDDIQDTALAAMADEIAHILEDGVVASAADVDACLVLGAGFPFFLGGLTKHLDQTGMSERVVGRPLAELGAAGG
jgi:3-hydroxyacyl-CoA dehydrogenase/enoyl-CoA hydratase/carnithine racemase